LKSAFDIADWSEEHFNNRALFADYYLRERLPEDPVWSEDPKPVFRRVRELYDRGASRWAGKAEQELRRNLFDPALHALGFDLEAVKAAPSDRLERRRCFCLRFEESSEAGHTRTHESAQMETDRGGHSPVADGSSNPRSATPSVPAQRAQGGHRLHGLRG
jgi:hypothetical protein